jgi:hypothetical protein
MKDFTMCPVLLAMSLALTSCSDSHVKNKLSQLEQQAALEEANIKTITNFYEFMDQQDSTSLEKLIGKDFALFFGSSEEPLRYNQIKPLINKVYLAFPD